MKNKHLYRVALGMVLLILITQACGNKDENTVNDCQVEIDENTSTVDPSQIEEHSLDFDGLKRNYMVFLPKNYTSNSHFPLVIYLHSYGWTAEMGMDYTMLNEVANACDFMVAYPSGDNHWNSGIADNASYPTPDNDDVGFINALIDTLGSDYSIDPNRIYATGYSNGGFMAYKLACQLSNRIAAIASVGGVLSSTTATNCNPLRTMPVLHIHGVEDGWVPIEGLRSKNWLSVDETLSYWRDINNCRKTRKTKLEDIEPSDDSTVEKISYTKCNDNSDVIYYKVINGGHTWPGPSQAGYGNLNQDFNAGVTIWNFFNDHQLEPIISEN